MNTTFTNEIILLVVAAFIGGFAARTIKLPPVVGYIVSGVVFGTFGRAFIPSYENLFRLSEIGISLLLFTLGFEISLKALNRINKKVLYIGFLQIFLTALFVFPILTLFQFELNISLLFAVLFSFSSSAVILKILEERGMVANFPGNNVFIILLLQDLFIVPVIFLMPFLFDSSFVFPQTLIDLAITLLKPLAAFIGMYIVGRVVLARLLKILFRYPQQELTILATIFTAVVSIGILMFAGLPQSIAAFFTGVLVSEEGKNMASLSAVKPLRDILLVLFFVLIGMFIDGGQLLPMLPVVIIVTVLIILIKFIVIFSILRFFKFLPSANVFISSHLSNIGEFAVVIAQIAFVSNFIGKGDYQLLLSFFIVSLIFIPFMLSGARYVFETYKKSDWVRKLFGDSHYFMRSNFEKIENHVVILGHGRVGREVRNLLDMGEVPYVVVDFDRRTIDSLTSNMKNALYGDPTDTDVLKSAGVENARIMVVALPDSNTQKAVIKSALNFNPKLTILCRSHIDEDKYELVNLGVNTIVLPEFEAGLRIGKKVLELLGFSEKNTIELLRKLRKFHFVH